MENTRAEPNLSITSNDINIKLNKEFLEELQKNTYHGWIDEDVVNHIAKELEMVGLIRVPGVDSHQLQMKVFPLSLTNDACDTIKEDEQSQTKRKYSNTSSYIDEQPNKKRCKAEKFKAIQYSLEEYIAIRSYEYDI
ncbi:hypothetical protein Tco_0347417 [Tanacetum coccineum]